MALLVLKALHLIGMVTWFAGLFYLVRLFVYHAETDEMEQPEREILSNQYGLMERRLFTIITTPGMVITWICGLFMLHLNPGYLGEPWLPIKLGLVVLLTLYHFWCGRLMRQLIEGRNRLSSQKFRMLNEAPTLLLVGIIFLAVLKNLTNVGIWAGGLVAFGLLLFAGIRIYKKMRQSH